MAGGTFAYLVITAVTVLEAPTPLTLFGRIEGVTRASETSVRVRRAMSLPVVS